MDYIRLRKNLLSWYQNNKRNLPWRNTKEPYFIWLSEIILQQTRIDQGMPYYLRFAERFPDVFCMAQAEEDEILKMWQGLGYYSRARNMHHTAKQIVNKYNGNFPNNYNSLLALKGIGDYTASLIASVCFNLPYAVLDGNVFRVLSRLFGINHAINTTTGKKIFSRSANTLIEPKNPGDFNQAMMELGALVCLPQVPLCNACPVAEFCYAFKNKMTISFPVKRPKEDLKMRYFNFIILTADEHLIIQKRLSDDIWKGLYQLPLIEKNSFEKVKSEEFENLISVKLTDFAEVSNTTHLLTHRKLQITFYKAKFKTIIDSLNDNFILIHRNDMNKYALPKPIENFMKDDNFN